MSCVARASPAAQRWRHHGKDMVHGCSNGAFSPADRGTNRAKIEKEAAQQPAPFDGCFVGTAMNHRAAMFTEIAERPITAAAAVTALRAGLAQFRARSGELYERMMARLAFSAC